MSSKTSIVGRWIAAALAFAFLVGVFVNVVIDNMPKGEVRKIEGYTAWDPETIKVAESIPVQNGGRVKPLSTYAGFTMLSLHGARSMKVEDKDGKKVTVDPTGWMLDTLFRPEYSIKLPTFRIDNSDVLENIGVKVLGRRDRYSYADIEPGRDKLIELAQSYEAIEKDKRDPVQNQTLALAYNLREYESLLSYFGFARTGIVLHGSGKDGAPDQRADVSAIMRTAPIIRDELSKARTQGQPMPHHIEALLRQVEDAANFSKFGLNLLPPPDKNDPTWLSAGDAIFSSLTDLKRDPAAMIAGIEVLEKTGRAIGESETAFRKQLQILHDDLVKQSAARGEGAHLPLEVSFYRNDWFLNSMAIFIFGSLTAFAMWVTSGLARRILSWVTFASCSVALVLCIIAITQRCLIMQRPPVGNLYDTIIFIAAAVVLIALAIEAMTRRGFALGVAPILGTMLIILARRFEVGDAKDNMDPLVAVLDSNYWLATHVLTITLGYAAGLLSAFLSFIYLLMRGLGLDGGDKDIRRALTRAVYGMICFTLFLSLVGTVLGGVWANDSWGRFWGWDPKENGALMIVLWTLAILHARLGGYVKEWGLHLCAVFTAAVVTFSWWHVNFLGVGLHNYGFTAGQETIWWFYVAIAAVLIYGAIVWSMDVDQKAKKRIKADKSDLPGGKLDVVEG